jgi:hypothetical protein
LDSSDAAADTCLMPPSVMASNSCSSTRLCIGLKITCPLPRRPLSAWLLCISPPLRLAFLRHRPQRLIETGISPDWTAVTRGGIRGACPKRRVHARFGRDSGALGAAFCQCNVIAAGLLENVARMLGYVVEWLPGAGGPMSIRWSTVDTKP